MAKAIKPDMFAREMQRILKEFQVEADEILDEEILEFGGDLVELIVQKSKGGHEANNPEARTGSYHKGWRLSERLGKSGRFHRIIHNATDYRLAHLLENPHKIHTKKGDRMSTPLPHIRPSFDELAPDFIERVKKRVGGR